MKFIVIAFFALIPSFVFANNDPAVGAKQAEIFIKNLGNEAIDVLESKNGDEDAIRAEFSRILNKNFDTDTIARFALGRYWSVATDAEKTEYKRLFGKMVVDVYSKRFSDYSGQSLNVQGAKPSGRKDYIVNSLIQGSGQPIRVDWRVRNGQVIDVIVEGVSMSITQRSEFASIIQRGGGQVSAIINHLKK